MTPLKRWTFRLVALVVLPAALLALVEVCFRLGNYGHRVEYFRPLRIEGREMLVENDKFGLTFFPPEVARSPAPTVMTAEKEPGTVRVFVLGESAALGDPRPAFGPARYLQVLLEKRFPGKKFEVVCTGMTAINSHAVLPIARECARHAGDVWIVYMGNNEMVGPYGAATVFGSRAPPLPYVRLNVALQRLRLGQWLLAVARKVRPVPPPDSSWGGMQMFLKSQIPPSDPRRHTVHDNFRRNLEDILRAGRRSGAKVVLSTAAVNLKDCPPFASLPGTAAGSPARAQFADLCARAIRAGAEGRPGEAALGFEQALKLDPGVAEVEYRLGQLRLAGSEVSIARAHFQRARDNDALPFRTDSQMNRDIERTSARYAQDPGFRFFDAQKLLDSQCHPDIAGAEVFYEHVHFNFAGNYVLGRAWAERVAELLGLEAEGAWASPSECDLALGLTPWNRFAVYDDMLARIKQPPFLNQFDHTNQLERLRRHLRDLRPGLTPEAASQAEKTYLEALKARPGDHRLHENFAEFLDLRGDLPRAVEQWDQVRKLLPHHHVAYFHGGHLSRRLGKLDDAEKLMGQAVQIRPDLAEGWLELGQVAALKGNHSQALEYFAKERSIVPGDHRVYLHIGRSLAQLNRRPEAIASLREAVRLNPDYWEAQYFLGEELAFDGKGTEARQHFETVTRLKPDFAMGHLNLGVALYQAGQIDAAIAQFEETRKLDPKNALAMKYLEKLRGEKATSPPTR